MKQRTLIFGASGQLGQALTCAGPADIEVIAHDSRTTDTRSREALRQAFRDVTPDCVINCSGYTGVDAAEENPEDAMEINAVAPGNIAECCREAGSRLVHISTDYVFDGKAGAPYATGASTAPLNQYGLSKQEGEKRVSEQLSSSVVLRTAWLHSGSKANFVATAARLLSQGITMSVVDDQVGTPTRALHLADAIWRIVKRPDISGVLHFTDAGVASWYDVAIAVRDALKGLDKLPVEVQVMPVGTESFPRPAIRPAISILDKRTTWAMLDYSPLHWREGVMNSTREYIIQSNG